MAGYRSICMIIAVRPILAVLFTLTLSVVFAVLPAFPIQLRLLVPAALFVMWRLSVASPASPRRSVRSARHR